MNWPHIKEVGGVWTGVHEWAVGGALAKPAQYVNQDPRAVLPFSKVGDRDHGVKSRREDNLTDRDGVVGSAQGV